MNLYEALQGVLDKIKQNNERVVYAGSEREMLQALLDNQERLAESVLILGGLMQGIVAKDVEIEVVMPKGTLKN